MTIEEFTTATIKGSGKIVNLIRNQPGLTLKQILFHTEGNKPMVVICLHFAIFLEMLEERKGLFSTKYYPLP